MEFCYRIDDVRNHCQDNCKKYFSPLFIGYLIIFGSLCFYLFDHNQGIFIISLLLIASLLQLTLLVFFFYNSWKKEYLSFIIDFNEDIIITRNKSSKTIRLNKIKNIYCDKKGNYYIKQSSFSEITILKYIENRIEFENILSSIKPIEKIGNHIKIIHYLPSFFFVGIIFINTFRNTYLYILFTFAIILSSIYSSILLILEEDKEKRVIGNLIINILFIAIFTIVLFHTIIYLKK